MTEVDEALQRLLKAQKAVAEADLARDVVMRRRDEAVRVANSAGVTYAKIREATGMSPATIAKAIDRDRRADTNV